MLPEIFFRHKRAFLIPTAILFSFIIAGLIFFLRGSPIRPSAPISKPTPQVSQPTIQPQVPMSRNYQIVYATFSPELSVTLALYNPQTNQSSSITELPFQTKNIIALGARHLLYMKNLDPFDRSDGIYEWKDGQEVKKITPAQNFVIDRFSLAPDNSTIVFWELANSPFLAENTSRIIVTPLSDPTKRLVLVDEIGGEQTHYPIAWFDNQTIIADTVSAYGGGLFGGLVLYDTSGQKAKQILAKGEYSSLPLVSPSHNEFLFTAYDPKASIQLPPLSPPSDLYPVSIRNPNRIVEYHKTTGEKTVLLQSTSGDLFDTLAYSPDGRVIAYRTRRIDSDKRETVPSGIYALNKQTKQIASLDAQGNGAIIAWVNADTLIVARRGTMLTPLGGFFSPYSAILEGVYALSVQTPKYTKILSDKPVQIIGVL